MKKTNGHIIAALVSIAFVCAAGYSGDIRDNNSRSGNAVTGPEGTPMGTLANINNVAAWYNANGEQERDPSTGNAGLVFPRGTATAIYSAGIIWGGIFNDGISPALRVNGQSYNNGTKPGRILGIRTGLAENPGNYDVRIWRIRRDYETANLTQDAAEFFGVPIGSVTQGQIDQLRAQYASDWLEWPWQKGAPFYDVNNNGVKDPGEDPGLAGADQILWYVCNDIGVDQPWTCPTSGIEQQTTIWAYNRPGGLSSTIFKRFRLFYKGVAASSPTARIDSMYVCQWSDPDIGAYTDDFAGCDSALSLGYGYNANPVDAQYVPFALPPPAAGYALLRGPMIPTGNQADTAIFNFRKVPGARNLPLNAFIYFAAGGRYSDPPFSYAGARQWYQMLRGIPPLPLGPPDPPRVVNPVTGQATSFWLSGDPVAGTGWRDGTWDPPGDRRLVLASGPFTLALGDSQEFVFATIAGLGTSHINSITVLRSNYNAVRTFIDSLSGIITAVNNEPSPMPSAFRLEQNYPNPFNPSTNFQFAIVNLEFVTLKVFDLLGREIATLVSGRKNPGTYNVVWDASKVPGGVYFARLQAGSFVETRKIILLK